MRRSVEQFPFTPDLVVVDGNCPIPALTCPQKTVIKGDARVLSVGAASVVAKVLRDRVMTSLDPFYPDYGFARHKGYPTKMHREVLQRLGPTPWHRRSFSW
jgi:ribonuclease HII